MRDFKGVEQDYFENNGESIIARKNPLGLPDELAEWADQNSTMIRRVLRALGESYVSLTEDQIWDAVAATSSPDWQRKRAALEVAEQSLNRLNDPLHVSLGAIGEAFESEETAGVHERYAYCLSDFTIINEGLRQRPDLSNLLSVLMAQKRMLERSETQTSRVAAVTAELGQIVPSLRADFAHAAKPRSKARKHFAAVVKKLLSPKRGAAVTSGTVPWLPKT